ncbi:MAG: ECF transporter S component [Clostridia bacterium]|nr:ECF transporter S component [Clostridia bacterium]MDD4798242.1 ECF transporter S component [Clostridia bacterium]
MSKTQRLTRMALLAAVSIVCILLIQIPIIPAAPFLKYDMADVPILMGAFMLGPLAGIEILVAVSAIQAFFMGGDGIIGLLMHVISSGTLIGVACLIYNKTGKSTKAMILGLVAGSLAMTVMMIPLNLIFTSLFMDVPLDKVISMLVPAIIPFNLLKAGLNSLIFFFVYKSIRFLFKEKSEIITPQLNK